MKKKTFLQKLSNKAKIGIVAAIVVLVTGCGAEHQKQVQNTRHDSQAKVESEKKAAAKSEADRKAAVEKATQEKAAADKKAAEEAAQAEAARQAAEAQAQAEAARQAAEAQAQAEAARQAAEAQAQAEADRQAAAAAQAAAQVPQSRTVYVAPQSGKKYHYHQNCRGLSNANGVSPMTESDAVANGYGLCGWED